MDPDVRYCTTQDGVRIAYAVSGSGDHWLVHTSNGLSAMLQYGNIPGRRAWVAELEAHFRLVQYDARGTGLSQRDVDDLSFEALMYDLESVIDAAGVDRATIFGFLGGTWLAVRYGAEHPDRVSHLALWPPPAIRFDAPEVRALSQVALADWVEFTEIYAHRIMGWDQGALSQAYARAMRETVARETWLRFMAEWTGRFGNSVDELCEPAPRVRAPTLCLQREGYDGFPQYAGPIAGASTRMFPGKSMVPYFEGGSEIAEAIAQFSGALERPQAAPARPHAASVQTVLFTDLVGHTEMMQRLGDTAGRDVLREHERITRDALNKHGGIEIKTGGDGFMMSFGSVTAAIDCAIAMQRAFAARNTSDGEPLHVRIGLNAGEPIEEEGDLFGSTVIMASRIAAQANAGEILIPEPLRHLLSGKNYVYADRGETMLKGFEDAVRLYEVRWRE